MSIKTWKEEFYPVEADSKEALKAPVAHSLRKWRGLTEKNLKKHGLEAQSGTLYDELVNPVFEIIGDTCALCCYVNSQSEDEFHEDTCHRCPLFKANEAACDDTDVAKSAYITFLDYGDPAPMINMLMNAKKKGYK